jgi:hypothetical protein
MAEWHFDLHETGWTWRCVSNGDARESTRDFPGVAEAEDDAMRHGYVPGMCNVGTIAARPAGSLSRMLSGGHTRGTLVVRRRAPQRWFWEMRATDGRVVCYTNADFATREETEEDAARRGAVA